MLQAGLTVLLVHKSLDGRNALQVTPFKVTQDRERIQGVDRERRGAYTRDTGADVDPFSPRA